MATRHRKVRHQRRSRTHGWGVSGQHRKGGMRGGHGKSGWSKHKWTYTVKYDRERIGKHGFRNPTSTQDMKTINIGDLEDLVRKKGESARIDGKPVIDLIQLGYNKLLGAGTISNPYLVKVERCSVTAEKKIEKCGGAVQKSESEEKE